MGLASCGSLVWRHRGQLRVTVIVKATFAFVPGGTMRLEAPDELHEAEVPWGERGSVWAASNRVPSRRRANVVLVGHAHLPPGGGVVRLAVFGERGLVDKSLGVSDDGGDGAPVSLAYERAFGGPSSAENPVGTGMVGGSPLPSLIDPAAPRRAGGFGPVARSWPARAWRLGALDPAVLDQPIAEVPGALDWGYFQAAPPGQVVDFLQGDEWILLEGMSREHPVLQTRLPGVAAAGRVYGIEGTPTLVFHADNLHIDADRGRCSLTSRASFAVSGEEVLPHLLLVAGIELPGQPIAWPVDDDDSELGLETLPFTTREPMVAPPTHRRATEVLAWPVLPEPAGDDEPLMGTMVLGADEGAPPPMASPFRLAEAGREGGYPQTPGAARAAGDLPGAPWATGAAASVPRPLGLEVTRSPVLPAPAIPRPAVKSHILARFPPGRSVEVRRSITIALLPRRARVTMTQGRAGGVD